MANAIVELLNNTVDIVQATINDANITVDTTGLDSDVVNIQMQALAKVGEQLGVYQAKRNAFLDTLINRIGMVYFHDIYFENPYKDFKNTINYGDTIQTIMVKLAEPFTYNLWDTDPHKMYDSGVIANYHVLNAQYYYPKTISDREFSLAFTTMTGIQDLISRIFDSISTAAERDDFLLFKYVLGINYLDSKVKTKLVVPPTFTTGGANEFTATVKSLYSKAKFITNRYNLIETDNSLPLNYARMVITSDALANQEVGSLASAFNLNYVEFLPRLYEIDTFDLSEKEESRLAKLIGKYVDKDTFVSEYTPLTADQHTELQKLIGFLFDKRWVQFYDYPILSRRNDNGVNTTYNIFVHFRKILSTTNYSNAIALTTDTTNVSTDVIVS